MEREAGAPLLSIVIPLLNERDNLPQLVGQLDGLMNIAGIEIIAVDGGSSDGTVAYLQQAGVAVITSRPGRARQMNAGADLCRGDTLLFLHADTRLPLHIQGQSLAIYLAEALNKSDRQWGRFDVAISGRHALLGMVAFFMNLRSRLTGIATGDQCIFVRRALFMQLGGFRDQPLMEDIELSARLRRVGKPLCLRHKVVTSGRRWDTHGLCKTVILMWRLRLAYWLGASPGALVQRYYRPDKQLSSESGPDHSGQHQGKA